MRIVGIGFRSAASEKSLNDALTRALLVSGEMGFDAVVTEAAKARTPVFRAFAQGLGVPGMGISDEDLGQMITPTQSQRIQDQFGTGSLAEAAALAAAGPQARLVVERVVSEDSMATAAVAEG